MSFWEENELKLIERDFVIWAVNQRHKKKIESLLSALEHCQRNMVYLHNELENLRENVNEKKDHPRKDDL